METKDIMSKFDELYGMMASSANVKYMHVFGNTMRCMMKDMASKHPELAQEYLDKLCAIKWCKCCCCAYFAAKECIKFCFKENRPRI